MTREDIEQLNVLVPYCFETDLEEKWYNSAGIRLQKSTLTNFTIGNI